MYDYDQLSGFRADWARITKVTSAYGEALTGSMFGNLTGTYPGIQAAFYEPGEPDIPAPGKSNPNSIRQYRHRISSNIKIHDYD